MSKKEWATVVNVKKEQANARRAACIMQGSSAGEAGTGRLEWGEELQSFKRLCTAMSAISEWSS